jgi:NAD(P)-dependent dehydrogenase (short-subunit alcohol dehydrogenase family)
MQAPIRADTPPIGPLRVIITGALSGLGAALARHYAARGATLGLVTRRRHELERLVAGFPGEAALYRADVRDTAALDAAGQDFIGRFGPPDIVIANAGISIGTLTQHAADREVFAEVMDINVDGAVNTFHPFLDAMLLRGSGKLVGIASVAGFRGLPGASAYSASKAALISYLESLRVELRPRGLEVITVCPGYVATPMTAANPYPMPFLLDADEAARRIARVIGRGASFAVVPWQMALAGKLLRWLPNGLYDRAFARAPRKPRRGE